MSHLSQYHPFAGCELAELCVADSDFVCESFEFVESLESVSPD